MRSHGVRSLLVALALAAGSGACGGRSTTNASSPVPDRDVIGADEIESVEVRTTALQLVQRFRPMWLQGRGQTGIRGSTSLMIYVNNQRDSSGLSRYAAGELYEIRFLNAMAATQRFGTGHGAGAILISTR